jgi:hypothetical protein
MHRLHLVALSTMLPLLGCEAPGTGEQLTVEAPRITLPAVRGRPGAAYFTLRSSAPVRVLSVTSPQVRRIELHDSVARGMAPLGEPALAAGETLVFAPGDKHAMLFGIDPSLKPGARITLTFSFDSAPALTTQADVLGPGGQTHDAH